MLILIMTAFALVFLALLVVAAVIAPPRATPQDLTRREALSAEARIDLLTRLAIQNMRDVARADMRERGDRRS